MYLCPGFEHKITVQASPKVDKRKTQGSESTTPPASPGVIPRLRAIRCKCKHLKWAQTSLHVWLTWPFFFFTSVTPTDGSKTWGRSAVCKKEDLTSSKKKGRTWGPSSTHQKERAGGEEKYVHSLHTVVTINMAQKTTSCSNCTCVALTFLPPKFRAIGLSS